MADYEAAGSFTGWVFFDRGLVDAVAAARHLASDASADGHCHAHRYNNLVFFVPPWSEIYVNDSERRHDLAEAISEYDRLAEFYPSRGYKLAVLPKISVEARVDFMLARLSLTG